MARWCCGTVGLIFGCCGTDPGFAGCIGDIRDIINQSINQSNLYIANIPSVARLSCAISKSVLNSKINEAVPQRQHDIEHSSVYEGSGQIWYVLGIFLRVAFEVDERTDNGKVFQREGTKELNDLFPALVLPLGTDKVIPLFDLSERDASGVASKDMAQDSIGFAPVLVLTLWNDRLLYLFDLSEWDGSGVASMEGR